MPRSCAFLVSCSLKVLTVAASGACGGLKRKGPPRGGPFVSPVSGAYSPSRLLSVLPVEPWVPFWDPPAEPFFDWRLAWSSVDWSPHWLSSWALLSPGLVDAGPAFC